MDPLDTLDDLVRTLTNAKLLKEEFDLIRKILIVVIRMQPNHVLKIAETDLADVAECHHYTAVRNYGNRTIEIWEVNR
jgi:hypothetical protein